MKYLPIALALLLIVSCSGGPLVTHGELEATIESIDARVDAECQWVIDMILNLLRSMFPEQSLQIPAIVLEKQPPSVQAIHDDGFDWASLEILLASLLGTGGAVGLRYLDHYRKAKRKEQRGQAS